MLTAGPDVTERLRGSFWHVWAVIWLLGALWTSSLGGLVVVADFSSWLSTGGTLLVALGTLAGAAFWSRRIAGAFL